MIAEHLATTLRLGDLVLRLPTHTGLDVLLALGLLGLVLTWGRDARYGGLLRGWALLTLLTALVQRFNLAWTGLILQTLLVGWTVVLANLYVGRIRRWLEVQERRLEPPPSTRATVMLGPAGRDDLIEAVKELSQHHIGALIVLDWSSSLDERLLPAAGVRLDAALSPELILTIFQRATPLHDGAIWIRDNRLLAAGVILPLSEQPASPQLGTRHRAALGLSERLETCVCIVVSEGTGSISLAERGHLHRLLTSTKLREMLEARLGGGSDSAVRPQSELVTPRPPGRPATHLRHLLTRLLGPTPPQGS